MESTNNNSPLSNRDRQQLFNAPISCLNLSNKYVRRLYFSTLSAGLLAGVSWLLYLFFKNNKDDRLGKGLGGITAVSTGIFVGLMLFGFLSYLCGNRKSPCNRSLFDDDDEEFRLDSLQQQVQIDPLPSYDAIGSFPSIALPLSLYNPLQPIDPPPPYTVTQQLLPMNPPLYRISSLDRFFSSYHIQRDIEQPEEIEMLNANFNA